MVGTLGTPGDQPDPRNFPALLIAISSYVPPCKLIPGEQKAASNTGFKRENQMQNTMPELMQSPLRSLPNKCGPTVMRKLLQSRATKKFLTVTGGWTRDIHRAADLIDT